MRYLRPLPESSVSLETTTLETATLEATPQSEQRTPAFQAETPALQAEVEQPSRAQVQLGEIAGGIQSAELFRLLVDSVRDYAIFLLDPSGRVATWNLGAERIKGYEATEIIGKHFSTFYPDAEARSGKCEHELDVAMREGRFEDEGWRMRKDGSRFWASVVITAVRNGAGELVGFAKVTRDLTEKKRAQEEESARRAAEEANRAKDEFLAMLGHELRNPLAPVVTALQLMKLRGDHRTSKEQQIIERQVKHMVHLVDDLLDISRITRGKLELKKQRIDIRDVVAKAVEVASPLLEQRSHHFEVDVPPHEIVLDADDARLTQVFANLLVNAAKYTEPSGHIGVTVRQESDQLVVEVCDDGIGIQPEALSKIFDLFVQANQTRDRSTGGLGIGLTLVRTLVHMHGGSVEARSAGTGRGSTFTVRLPLVGDAAVDATSPSGLVTFPGARRIRRIRRILIVDDNEDALVLLAEVFSAVGHDVKTASDAFAAIDLVSDFKPDVAILDIGLPDMDGYALAARLRAELGLQTPRLIALSGYGQDNDRARSLRAGFDAHLVKPVDAERLLDTITALDS
jgi:hypothetical protein